MDKILLKDESDTNKAGAILSHFLFSQAQKLDRALCVFLLGDLGAGKTTITRSILKTLGYEGIVKSPTYTLVEPYNVKGLDVYHFDLYRLNDEEELEFIGVRDYFNKQAICLIEWPQKALNVLSKPDIILNLNYGDNVRYLSLQSDTIAIDAISASIKEAL